MPLDGLHLALGGLLGAATVVATWALTAWGRARADARDARDALARREDDLEQTRRRARALAVMANSAKAMRNEFLSNISHEVRTPMNTVMGMTELALGTELSEKQRRYLERVREAGASLLGLLNDLLDLSKIHARRLRVVPHEFHLRDCLGDITQRYRGRARQKGLTLVTEIADDVPDEVIGDAGRLRQMVGALLSNAVKFSDGGTVELRGRLVSRERQRALVELAVRDEGVGIPRARQAAIFEAFKQVDGSETRSAGGVGIGLAIAAEVAQMMGGRIDVDSHPGRGSTFTLTIPLALPPGVAEALDAVRPSLAGRRALVVNDHSEMREALADMLAAEGVDVLQAPSGAARRHLAGAAAVDRPFDVVLVDGSAPRTDAPALAAQLLETGWLDGARLMVVTSAGHRGDAARCRDLGVAAYLTFPLSAEDLAEAVAMALQGPAEGHPHLITNHAARERRQAARPTSPAGA